MYLYLWSWLILDPGLNRDCMNRSRKAGTLIWSPERKENRWVKSFRPPPLGGAAQVQGGPVPHQLHRRRVHAAEHLEENRDVCWVQGPLGQHGAQRLAGTRVSSCCAQSESDLAGVVTSDRRGNKPPRQLTSKPKFVHNRRFRIEQKRTPPLIPHWANLQNYSINIVKRREIVLTQKK